MEKIKFYKNVDKLEKIYLRDEIKKMSIEELRILYKQCSNIFYEKLETLKPTSDFHNVYYSLVYGVIRTREEEKIISAFKQLVKNYNMNFEKKVNI